jgi:hypothetical protein
VQLWNDEIIDRERIDTCDMSEAEARERAEFWYYAAKLYRHRETDGSDGQASAENHARHRATPLSVKTRELVTSWVG